MLYRGGQRYVGKKTKETYPLTLDEAPAPRWV